MPLNNIPKNSMKCLSIKGRKTFFFSRKYFIYTTYEIRKTHTSYVVYEILYLRWPVCEKVKN